MAVDPAERLLNLIIALTHARVRMTRAQIRASVVGYEPPAAGLSPDEARKKEAAFERMFERDKDELRRMGIPLRTVTDATHGDEIGYKIDASDAAMPAIDLSAAEAATLAAATQYWQGALLSADADRGLTKIASAVAEAPKAADALGVRASARAAASSDAIAVIAECRAKRQAVRFDYASPTAGLATRTVEPWVIQVRGSADYLYGWDRDRQEPRSFRIQRIQSAVTAWGDEGSYTIPDPLPSVEGQELRASRTATIGLRPESGHSLREWGQVIDSDGQWDIVEVEFRYSDWVTNEVLRLGGSGRVMAPDEVAASVIRHAEAARAAALASLEAGDGNG